MGEILLIGEFAIHFFDQGLNKEKNIQIGGNIGYMIETFYNLNEKIICIGYCGNDKYAREIEGYMKKDVNSIYYTKLKDIVHLKFIYQVAKAIN